MGKKLGFKEKDLMEHCDDIFSFFDSISWQNPNGEDTDLGSFLFDFGKVSDITGGDIDDRIMNLYKIGFAFGYVIGQKCYVTDQVIKKAVQSINQFIGEKPLLPYIPRQESAA